MRVLVYLLIAVYPIAASDSLVQVFKRAVTALSAGDYGSAEKGFREVLQSVPNHAGALLNLGVVYSRTGRFDDAILLYRTVLQSNPSDKVALANLGVAYVKNSSFADAVPVFHKLAEVNPASAVLRDRDLMYALAAGYLRLNTGEEARRAVQHILEGPTGVYVLCQVDLEAGRYEEAAGECRTAGAHRELGKVLVGQHSADAIAELESAIRQDSKDAEAQYYLGVALLQADRAPDAAASLQRAMQLNNHFWGTYFYLGRARLELGQIADAVSLLRKAAEMNPRSAPVFYELGRALMATGEPAEAKQAMQRVRELRTQELEADTQALHKR